MLFGASKATFTAQLNSAMSQSPSLKKTTREKIFDVVLRTFEELTGHPTTEKVKKRIEKKSRKLANTLVTLLKKDVRKQEKVTKKSAPKEKKAKSAKVKKIIASN
jgi:DNA-binding ferritin-like protein